MSNSMSQIKHIVYLMLENRSFDNVLGWLYDTSSLPSDFNLVSNASQQNVKFYGLKEKTYSNNDSKGKSHYVTKVSSGSPYEIPNPDPHEEYQYISKQLFGADSPATPADNTPATCSGFLTDYESNTSDNPLQILQAYTPEQLPALNTLAADFGVSDYWFSSVPTQTNCNRAFSLAGTSLGQVNNRGLLGSEATDRFDTPCIFNVLYNNGYKSELDWRIYSNGDASLISDWTFVHDLFPAIPAASEHITTDFSSFVRDAGNGLLPKFSYLEPAWYGASLSNFNGNSYHPPAELGPGETFVKTVYDALTSTPEALNAFNSMLLIITFDEHGGTYDHVPPPWGATPPWGSGPPPSGITLEQGFKFNRFGVRVPTLLISPLIPKNTVFRSLTDVPYDHTSMIATVLTWFGIAKSDWGLGDRVSNASTFDNVLSLTTPRTDIPMLGLGPVSANALPSTETPVSDLQADMLPRVLRHLSGGRLSGAEVVKTSTSMLSNSKTLGQLQTAMKEFGSRMSG